MARRRPPWTGRRDSVGVRGGGCEVPGRQPGGPRTGPGHRHRLAGPEPCRDGRRAGRCGQPSVPPGLRSSTTRCAIRSRQASGTRGDRSHRRVPTRRAGSPVNGFGAGLVRRGLLGALGEPDQLLRLARFRAAHPEVIIGDGGFGTVQARIPEPDGETVITRYTLRELLDRLDELTAEPNDQPGCTPG